MKEIPKFAHEAKIFLLFSSTSYTLLDYPSIYLYVNRLYIDIYQTPIWTLSGVYSVQN